MKETRPRHQLSTTKHLCHESERQSSGQKINSSTLQIKNLQSVFKTNVQLLLLGCSMKSRPTAKKTHNMIFCPTEVDKTNIPDSVIKSSTITLQQIHPLCSLEVEFWEQSLCCCCTNCSRYFVHPISINQASSRNGHTVKWGIYWGSCPVCTCRHISPSQLRFWSVTKETRPNRSQVSVPFNHIILSPECQEKNYNLSVCWQVLHQQLTCLYKY